MKLYCDRTRARYAAKRELSKGDIAVEPKEGFAFEIIERDGKFGWVVPNSVQAPVTDFEVAEAQAVREEKIVEMANEMQAVKPRKARKVRGTAENPVFGVPFADPAEDPTPAEDLPEPAPEYPTSFIPDAKNGEIASREYGMLLTRERAGEAAKAAGVSDPVITQTGRGMWVWRTPALNAIWRESQKAPKNPAAPVAVPAANGKAKAPKARRGGSKLDIAEALLRRPEGATPEEVAAQVDGWDARSAKIRIGTCLKLTRKLPIVCSVEEGRGRVYRIAA